MFDSFALRRLLPPHLVFLLVVVSIAAGSIAPIAGPPPWPWRVVAIVPMVAGAALTVRSAGLFARRGTNIRTFDDPGELVRDGAFRATRNPMYVGFVLLLVGVALAVGTVTAGVGPVLFFLAADRWYIPFEESRMRAKFGVEYDRYVEQVPRWVRLGARRRVDQSDSTEVSV